MTRPAVSEGGVGVTTLAHRSAEVMAAIPGLLRSEIPTSMRGWPHALVIGVMLEFAEPMDDRRLVLDRAGAISRYVSEHMRMRFRPHGRRKLDALMARHLAEIATHG